MKIAPGFLNRAERFFEGTDKILAASDGDSLFVQGRQFFGLEELPGKKQLPRWRFRGWAKKHHQRIPINKIYWRIAAACVDNKMAKFRRRRAVHPPGGSFERATK